MGQEKVDEKLETGNEQSCVFCKGVGSALDPCGNQDRTKQSMQ